MPPFNRRTLKTHVNVQCTYKSCELERVLNHTQSSTSRLKTGVSPEILVKTGVTFTKPETFLLREHNLGDQPDSRDGKGHGPSLASEEDVQEVSRRVFLELSAAVRVGPGRHEDVYARPPPVAPRVQGRGLLVHTPGRRPPPVGRAVLRAHAIHTREGDRHPSAAPEAPTNKDGFGETQRRRDSFHEENPESPPTPSSPPNSSDGED